MKPKKLDAALILGQLAEMRRSIPYLDETPPQKGTSDGRMSAIAGIEPRTAEEFEYLAVAEGIESLANELSSVIERKRAEALKMALDVYYAAEELSRDPEHAELIPHVQRMREAYQRDFGKPIPPRPKS